MSGSESHEEFWGVSKDALAESGIWEVESEAVGAHYICFRGSREEATKRIMAALGIVVELYLYRATSYGSPNRWHEETKA